jgi:glycosyltransferase involved in cell wall biosynthesis
MISVTILTKNNEKYIREVLTSVGSFDEVLVYDNGSKDKTLTIARSFPNVTIVEGPFMGFGPTHNHASSLAKNDWIFSLDSDEVAQPELMKEILGLELNPECVYSIPRDNYYRKKHIKGCGWYPDRQYRIYHRKHTSFTDVQVHEQVIVDGMEHVPLQHSMVHYSYASIGEFLDKMQSYSELFAKQNKGEMVSSPLKAVTHGFFAFVKSYIIKKGVFDGYEGFLISAYNAHTAFYKYMKLYEENLNNSD